MLQCLALCCLSPFRDSLCLRRNGMETLKRWAAFAAPALLLLTAASIQAAPPGKDAWPSGLRPCRWSRATLI